MQEEVTPTPRRNLSEDFEHIESVFLRTEEMSASRKVSRASSNYSIDQFGTPQGPLSRNRSPREVVSESTYEEESEPDTVTKRLVHHQVSIHDNDEDDTSEE